MELAHHGPEDLFIATLMLIGSFVYLLTINVPLTLISLWLHTHHRVVCPHQKAQDGGSIYTRTQADCRCERGSREQPCRH